MGIFSITSDAIGAVAAVNFTGGHTVTSITELREFMDSNEGELFYGEGVHRIGVALKGEKEKFRANTARNGEMIQLKYGKATLVDIGAWKLDVQVDRDEEMLEGLKVRGRIPSTPTAIVINDYKRAVFDSKSYKYARDSKVSFMEAMLSSSRIPTQGFKPAYGGGLMSSPADSSKVYEDVISYDIASSYPWTAATTAVPYGYTVSVPVPKLKKFKIVNGKINLGEGVGFIGLFRFTGLKRRDWVKIPVIRAKDDQACENAKFDKNGLVTADELKIALVPDSLHSLWVQYEWDSYSIEIMETHRIQRLPKGIRSALGGYYEAKAKAVGADRLRAKLAINTLIGLWGTDPFKKGEKMVLKNGVYYSQYTRDLPKPWASYVGVEKDGSTSGGKRTWDFRWAVYTIAAAQRRIVETEFFLQQAGFEVLYCDTDSIKMAGNAEDAAKLFGKLNAKVARLNDELNLPEGMGLWVDESKGYKRVVFRAKKFYATEDENGNRGVHISGVKKEFAERIIEENTLEELAAKDEVIVQTARPDFAIVPGSPFGAAQHMLQREMIRCYTRTTMLVSGGDNVQV